MHAERDALVKRVFPQLRTICEARGVQLNEVDLRWGITAEESKQAKVLEICLREAINCRPYFIGLLGERYGWVPETISAQLLEDFPELKHSMGQSITEMEIRFGILSEEAKRDRSVFYIRKAGSEAVTRDARSENLNRLIRSSGALVREAYRDADELGELVRVDLLRFIDADFPETSVENAIEAARFRHQHFLATHHFDHVPPANAYEALEAAAVPAGGPLLVCGPQGAGKSALLANWCRERAAQSVGSATICAAHIGRTIRPALRDLLSYLASELAKGAIEVDSKSTDELRNLFHELLGTASEASRIVLVLDDLDALEDFEGACDLTWLPHPLPKLVSVIVSASELRIVDELIARGWRTYTLPPLSQSERAELAKAFFSKYQKHVTATQLARLIKPDATSNPLFLLTLLEELRVFGSFERLEEEMDRYASSRSPVELFDQVILRLERDLDCKRGDFVRDALSLLTCARDGLAEAELRELLGDNGDLVPAAYWSPLRFALGTHLDDFDGVLQLATPSLIKAIKLRCLPDPELEAAIHRRLATYFSKARPTRRTLREHAWQLASGRAWPELAELLTDPDYTVRAAKTDWVGFMQIAATLATGTKIPGYELFDGQSFRFGKRLDAVVIIAYLMEQHEWDSRNLDYQVKQEEATRAPKLLDSMEMLTGRIGHEHEAMRADIAAGRRGFWSQASALMLQTPYHRLRLCATRDGVAVRLLATPEGPEKLVGRVLRDIDYQTKVGTKFALYRHHSDTRIKEAQGLLNRAGINVGHTKFSFLGVDTPVNKIPTEADVLESLELYNQAFDAFGALDHLELMAFILQQKLTLPQSSNAVEIGFRQSQAGRARALELNRREAAAQFALLEGLLALRSRAPNHVKLARHHLQTAICDLEVAGLQIGIEPAARILAELESMLRLAT